MLRGYELICNGAANRIIALAEKEQEIRGRDNKQILLTDFTRVWGSIFVSIILIIAGVYCAVVVSPWLGALMCSTGAVSGVIKAIMKE